MASSSSHPNEPTVSSEDHKVPDLDPKRLLAMCGFELRSAAIDGDVLIDLEHGRIPVQSDVLTRASPVFKAMLGPNFSEGQAPRSAANPKIIALEDDDTESMTALCVLLHKDISTVHLNASDELAETAHPSRIFRVAVLADKYALVNHLETVMGLSLLAPFTRKHQVRKLDLSQALYLVAAAYLLQQAELFSLFARRLALDYGDLSTLLDFTDLFDHMPASCILHIEDQHNFLRARINAAVDYVSARTCYMCGTEKYDPNLADTIAQRLDPKKDHWPPDYLEQHTLRDALIAFGSMPEYIAFEGSPYALCPRHSNQSFSRAKFFETTAQDISKSAEVLCYTCTREERHYAQCPHQEKLRERMQELDPLFSSATHDVSLQTRERVGNDRTI